jgi:hypothetical protein
MYAKPSWGHVNGEQSWSLRYELAQKTFTLLMIIGLLFKQLPRFP